MSFSGGQLYGRVNGGVDAGSTLDDNLNELMTVGAVPESMVGPLDWKKDKWPPGWQEAAKPYRITEAWDAPTFAEMASALMRGFVVVYGIMIGTNFVVQPDGWVAPRRGSGGGHAMLGVGLVVEQARVGILTLNSWGERWGRSGLAIVPEDYFTGWIDGYAVRSAIYQ